MTAKLTDLQRGAILADYRAGKKLEEIAATYGVSHTYPVILAKRRGLGKRQARSKVLVSVYQKILEAKRNGYSAEKIAQSWDLSVRHVQRIVQEMSGADA